MQEKKTIFITAILNFIVATLKLVTGIIFSFSTLISDSIQSFIDFFTDIISLMVNRVGKRRANKTYPFGYGQVYYLSNLLTGVLLFLIGIYIIYQVTTLNTTFTPNIKVLIILILVLVIKGIVIYLLQRYTKNIKSELMIESYKESKADLLSTCVVIIVLIISYFKEYIPIDIDKIGSICMAIYVFYTAIKMIISNIRGILVNDVDNEEVKENIIKDLEKFKKFKVTKVKVIKMSSYYSIFIQIDVDNNIKIKDYLKIERKLKRYLKDSNKSIKYIDVEPI
ncbi:MAG: cation diffusion facilitator family transporter [Bacilli bacterium]|nr:cation diffusion facilitator family transporter [Bacilli bacterium]